MYEEDSHKSSINLSLSLGHLFRKKMDIYLPILMAIDMRKIQIFFDIFFLLFGGKLI